MRRFLLTNATKVVVTLGVMCLILAAAIWYRGTEDSQNTQIMAENLAKEYLGGGWYPANGIDYSLEARIIGHEEWVANAIKANPGDQIEFRVRIASGDGVPSKWVGLAMAYDNTQLRETTERDENRLRVYQSYESPDIEHIVYVPVGTYAVRNNIWLSRTGAYYFGVTYNGLNEIAYRKILVVPPYSEVAFRAILWSAGIGLICLFILTPITVLAYRRYEKECYG